MLSASRTRLAPHRLLVRSRQISSLSGAPIDIHPEVQEALASSRPVVALETTVITHGMAYPTNIKLANSLESIVRSQGAVPATIGIVQGRVKIGLEPAWLERLANTAENPNIHKVSRRDIAATIVNKADGGTTCSSTLIFAALAGIKVFATGGLGGVHRGGENSMDVSADLQELTRCPVGLVSAGVKSILDIGRTLEYLETLGVPVISYGETKDFPAFFTRKSEFKAPWHVNNPVSAAEILLTHERLQMRNGALFAVPIPAEHEADGVKIEEAIKQAVYESEQNGISKRGREATPWLLSRIHQLTGGDALNANVALLENTALVGSQIAVEYSKLLSHPVTSSFTPGVQSLPTSSPPAPPTQPEPVLASVAVVGSSAIDISAQCPDPSLATHTTVPGRISLSLGGVARNIAEACHRLSPPSSTLLIASVGQDAFGTLMSTELKVMGMRSDGLISQQGQSTAVCNMTIDDKGSLAFGVADMDITANVDSGEVIRKLQEAKPRIVALDGNLSSETIASISKYCERTQSHLLFEPTSITKSTRILQAISKQLTEGSVTSPIYACTPNTLELAEIYNEARQGPLDLMSHPGWWSALDGWGIGSHFRAELDILARQSAGEVGQGTLSFLVDQGIAQMAMHLLPFFQHLLIKCGDKGVVVASRFSSDSAWSSEKSNMYARTVVAQGSSGGVVITHYPALRVDNIVNVTGAGDTFVGTILSQLAQTPDALDNGPKALQSVIDMAQRGACATLQSSLAVSPSLADIARQ